MKNRNKMPLSFAVAIVVVALALASSPTQAVTLLSTTFTGMSIDGTDPNKANGIVWTGTELSAPGSLSLENVIVNQNDGQLLDSGAFQTSTGYFGANTNLSRSPSDGQWGTTIPLTVLGSGVSLENVVINLSYSSNSGAANTGNHTTLITVTVVDTSNSSVVGTANTGDFTPNPRAGGDGTATFAAPISLAGGGVYNVSFLVESNSGVGHYGSFNALDFNGTPIPEPSAFFLGSFGLIALLRRRR